MRRHIGDRRKEAAQLKIAKKVNVLERYVADPAAIPEGAYKPRNLAAFREWEDKVLGLEKIGSPNTMDRSYNKQQKEYVLSLIEKLAAKKKRKDRRGKDIDTLRARNKTHVRLEREMANQLHSTRMELDRSQQSERRLQARVNDLVEENGELRSQLKKITGLKPVTGPARG